MPHHKVRTHRWINGFLEVVEQLFEHESDAMYYARTTPSSSVKVFGVEGELIHVEKNVTPVLESQPVVEATPAPIDDGYTYPSDNGYSYNDDFNFDDSYA